ncbi:hypothetical protein PAMA_013723 [Pampus argenteus]
MELHSAITYIGILFLSPRITAQLIPQEYHFINQSMTWYEAQSYCRLKYTDLATVNNMDDNNRLLNTLDSHVTHSWIGLQDNGTNRWMWSDGSGTARFTKWGTGEPNNRGNNEGCGEVITTDTWNDLNCEATLSFVCYERQQDGTVEYKYYSQTKSWVNSQDTCRTNHTDLVSITTPEDNSGIVSLATKMKVDNVWVGLFKDTWMWSDGSDASFRYWLRDSDKKEDCCYCSSFAVSQRGRWVPTLCSQKATFVCHGDDMDGLGYLTYVSTATDKSLSIKAETTARYEEIEEDLYMSLYIQPNCDSTNLQLFSFLALLNAYVPDSYLLMSECQRVLGPPDPIHGGPPFEERMEPFTRLINTSSPEVDHVCMVDQVTAQIVVETLADLGITRSDTVKKLMSTLCGDQAEPHTIQFIKDLLTKRNEGKKGKEKFSRLIETIKDNNIYYAISVMKTASAKFKQNPIFPQTLSRLYYVYHDYNKAEEWARTAIRRAPNNSYMADTLGQVYKQRLRREAKTPEEILARAKEAFKYIQKEAAESTSFPGLLECLNHELFTSKGRRAWFNDEKTVSDLEEIRDDLKMTYEENVDDVEVAERYILSNIILSNKMPNSPHLTPVGKLQELLRRFSVTKKGQRSPEFYLLVLLLFWPEEHPQVMQEEEATADGRSEGRTSADEGNDGEHKTGGEPAQLVLPLDLMFDPDLQQHVTFMENAFESGKYGKYLRGRYLLPLFFLGKGCGLCKWVHKSRLDAIVEDVADAELDAALEERNVEKWSRINKMWSNGEVWQVPQIQDILLPVQVESFQAPTVPLMNNNKEVFVCAGGKKIKAVVDNPDAPTLPTTLFYLGFTIRGPVVFSSHVWDSE